MLKEKLVPVIDGQEDIIDTELEPVKLQDFITQYFETVESDNAEDRLRRFKKWSKNRAFYRGNQRGVWDTKRKAWVTIDIDTLTPSEQSMLVINNQFRPQVKTLAKEFSRSQTRIRANARSDSQSAVLASRFTDALIRYYQPKLLPESLRQLRAKYLMLCGNSFQYTYYDKEKKSATVSVKKTGRVMLPAYESNTCSECGYEGESGEQQCPECKGVMETTNVEAQETQGVLGYEKRNAGDVVTEIVDPTEIDVWGGASCLDESPYIKRRRIVKHGYLRKTYSFYKPKTDSKLSDQGQLQLQFSDTAINSENTQKNIGLYEHEQLWIDVSEYYGKKLDEPFTFKKKTAKGWVSVTLPAGTVLEQEFPDGMYIARVGQDILCIYNENKRDCWKHTAFDINVDGFWGDGLEDAVMNQQIINEYTSLSVENVLYNASPKLVINPELINPVTVTGRPKDLLLMSNNARREDPPKNAFAQISGMSLTNEVMMGIDNYKRDMREQTGALVAFNGQGDPTLTTATAMSIARDSALALVSTPLAILAETDQEWIWQVIKYVKKFWYDQKYSFLLGKYNEAEADAFKESNLEEEINVYVESNSWMPQTNYERLQNLGAYMTAFGIPMGFMNPMIPQPVREYATQLYNIPVDFNELYPDIRIAQKRLDIGKDVAKVQIPKAMAEVQALTQTGQHLAPITLADGTQTTKGEAVLQATRNIIADAIGIEEDIDDLQVFIDEYIKYLKTDEGQNAHAIFREAVKVVISECKNFLKIQQAEQAQMQAMMNPQPQQGQGGGGGQQPFQPQNAAEHPFAPEKVGEVKDYSDNAKK